jgi:site-specific recombinase XerD
LEAFYAYKRLCGFIRERRVLAVQTRREKKLFTDKSMQTRAAMMANWIVPLWGEQNPKRLTVRMIDQAMMGVTSDLTKRPLAGATRNRILSVLLELYVHLIEEGHLRINPVRDVVRCNSYPEQPRSALPTMDVKVLFPDDHAKLKQSGVLKNTSALF